MLLSDYPRVRHSHKRRGFHKPGQDEKSAIKTGTRTAVMVMCDELSVKSSEWLRERPGKAPLPTSCSDTTEIMLQQDETNITNFPPGQ